MFLKIYLILLPLIFLLAVRESKAVERKNETAIFAGGCFWCMESPFEKHKGVFEVISGYTGGEKENPTYNEVAAGKTKHLEAIKITFDPTQISYSELLDIFWMQIDPTDNGGQFVDRGPQYKTAIFYLTPEQKRLAEKSKAELNTSGMFDKPVVTKIIKATQFYRAEEYHQDFYKKSPAHYYSYRKGSGRDRFLNITWNDRLKMMEKNAEKPFLKPSEEELKKKLTPLQYDVTQNNGTERPFQNKYWDNKKEGIYVDVISGEPLFSSLDKYQSGTGWPSFTKPINEDNIARVEDKGMFMVRTEIRSKLADSHLGHVFTDGPQPTGLRYCMNSAALRFVPKEILEREGFEEYVQLFKK